MIPIVIYSSKTGFAKRYAQWIAEELSAEAVPFDKAIAPDLKKYDAIVFGGGLYAGGINGLKAFRKLLPDLSGKRIAIFATGASPGKQEIFEEIRDKNLTLEEQKSVGFFYLRGGFNYDKLGVKDKMLMALLKKKLQSKKDLTKDEAGMLSAYDEPVDFTDREKIRPLVDYVNGN